MKDLQLEFFDIPSPCKGVCKSDDRGYCQGCFRTRDERFGWLNFTNAEKQRVIKLCQQREKRRNQPKKVVAEATSRQPEQASLLDTPASDLLDSKVSSNDFDDFEL
ncbi:DUF1289 domain-containing protein [Thalassotalea mangrovi]|uniref:DUF1289 domain-containing protein n=1 Tax=Thalassotalea mangrovi TaxID=2572245 RepID=A0A4U1BBJ0_9GAMM|nr:DUF1289 domain-containing protein [Thalassotalea mangrovi]TKB47538.1 DUF1289 domain-containing protein [Thalassotalea mangrovi]